MEARQVEPGSADRGSPAPAPVRPRRLGSAKSSRRPCARSAPPSAAARLRGTSHVAAGDPRRAVRAGRAARHRRLRAARRRSTCPGSRPRRMRPRCPRAAARAAAPARSAGRRPAPTRRGRGQRGGRRQRRHGDASRHVGGEGRIVSTGCCFNPWDEPNDAGPAPQSRRSVSARTAPRRARARAGSAPRGTPPTARAGCRARVRRRPGRPTPVGRAGG